MRINQTVRIEETAAGDEPRKWLPTLLIALLTLRI